MEKAIPVLLIISLLGVFNPISLDSNQDQLYLVDISAIEITHAGTERYVSDAGITLIDLSSGNEIRPYKSTSSCNSYSFMAESREAQYCVEVRNNDYKVVNGRDLDLRKAKGFTWKVVYIEKASEKLLNSSVDNPRVM